MQIGIQKENWIEKLGDQLMKKINFYIQRDFILQKLRKKICQKIILKWYMTGFVKTSGVKDLYYTYLKENHLFKDDYLYISHDKKIEKIKGKYGNDEVRYFDFFICGGDIIKVLFAIEKNSDIDTTEIRNKIKEKFEWWKTNEQNDYRRSFRGKEIEDIFEYYEKTLYKKGEK